MFDVDDDSNKKFVVGRKLARPCFCCCCCFFYSFSFILTRKKALCASTPTLDLGVDGHIGTFCATSTSATLSPCGLRRRSGTVSRPNPSSRSSLLPVLAGVVGVFSSWIFFYVRRHSLASSTSSLSFRCIRQGFVPDAISVEIDERRKSKVTANTTETRNRARQNLTAT